MHVIYPKADVPVVQLSLKQSWGPSRAFDAWLNGVPLGGNPRDPDKLLARREAAPAARAVHPRDEHLLPLHVAVGAAGDDAAELTYHENDFLGGLTVSSHRFRTAA